MLKAEASPSPCLPGPLSSAQGPEWLILSPSLLYHNSEAFRDDMAPVFQETHKAHKTEQRQRDGLAVRTRGLKPNGQGH